MVEDLLATAREGGARRLLVAGDVKHPIVGTPRALRPVVFDFFATLLGDGLAVSVILGNHDVGLVPHLPREVEVVPPSGLSFEGVGVFHGHRWPSSAVLAQSRLVVGHLHPGVRLAPSPDRPTGKERCWVRVDVRPVPSARTRRPSAKPVTAAREVVVLPAFNPLAGTEALNREKPRRGRSFLYRRFLSLGPARAYLLDGTDVGALPTRRAAPTSGEAPRPSRDP